MKFNFNKILLFILAYSLFSCNKTELDSKGFKLEGKSIFWIKYGEWKSYYKNGELWQVNNFKFNKPDGKYIAYFSKEYLKQEGYEYHKSVSYIGSDTIKEVYYVDYKYNIKIQVDSINELPIQEIGYFKKGKANGIFKLYFHDENTFTKTKFVDGEIKDEILEYYNTGQLRSKCKTKNGKKDGKVKIYNKEGKMFAIETYVNGKKTDYERLN